MIFINNYTKVLVDADSLCFTSLEDSYEIGVKKLEWKIYNIKKFIDWSGEPIVFYLTMGKSFRNELQVDYKAQRTTKPKLVNDLKKYLIENYDVIIEKGYEADDLIAEEYKKGEYLLCSIDKDLLYNIPGKHINLYRNLDVIETTEEQAFYNFHKQIIIGDTIDNIPTLLKGLGEKRIKYILDESGLKIDELAYYLCEKLGVDYITRYKMLYCGKLDINTIEIPNKIQTNDVVDQCVELIRNNKQLKKQKPKKEKIVKEKPKKEKNKHIIDGIFTFGKYKGKSIEWVKEKNISYLYWCETNIPDFNY